MSLNQGFLLGMCAPCLPASVRAILTFPIVRSPSYSMRDEAMTSRLITNMDGKIPIP